MSFHNEYWLTQNLAFTGEVWLGHLRYGTHGKNSIENCHPILRQSNWRSRSLALAGNFNMTNVDQLVQILIDLGQHPKGEIRYSNCTGKNWAIFWMKKIR